jgi:hypothetical protein
MSTLQLGIFKNLRGYLVAASTNDDAANRYYLQKYYKPKAHNMRDEDVAPQFTNAVVKFAKQLRNYDVSVGASPTLKNLLVNAATKAINDVSVTASNTTDLETNLQSALLIDAMVDTAGKVTANKLQLNLVSVLTNTINGNSGLLPADKVNAVACLNGVSGVKPGTKTVCDALDLSALNLDLIVTVTAGTAGTPVTLTDGNVAVKAVKDKLVEIVSTRIGNWINANYNVDSMRVTGEKEEVAKVLKALKSRDVDEMDLKLFNDYFLVMKKTASGWAECSTQEIDENNLVNFRINAKMTNLNNTRVPSIVALVPKVQVGTKIGYNDGNVAKDVSNEDDLKMIFQAAYNDSLSLMPAFDDNASSDLRPDLESLFKDVLLRKTTPEVNVDVSEMAQNARILSKWQRVGEDTWVHTLSDGTKVTMKPNTTEFDAEVSKEVTNCAAVGFSNDPVQCASFLRNVALDNTEELAKVASSLTDEVAPEVVVNLHPKFALAILKSFGFRRKLCRDRVAGRQIEKIQSVQEWQEKFVDKKFADKTTVQNIKSNTKLLNFLGLLSQLVNSNPSVLNDGLVVETEESRGEISVPKELAARKITHARMSKNSKPVLSWSEIKDNMNKIYGSFSKGLTFDGLNTNSPFGMDNLFPQMTMLTGAPVVRGSTWGAMIGGAEPETKVFLDDHQTGLEYSKTIQKIIFELMENLKRTGKTFNKADTEVIAKKLTSFEQLERDLFEIAWYIQKYSQLLKIAESENRPELITRQHVENYVNKYNVLASKHEKTGNALNLLASLLSDCSKDEANCETV